MKNDISAEILTDGGEEKQKNVIKVIKKQGKETGRQKEAILQTLLKKDTIKSVRTKEVLHQCWSDICHINQRKAEGKYTENSWGLSSVIQEKKISSRQVAS